MTEREEQAVVVLNTLHNNPLLSDIHRQALEVGIMAIDALSRSENQNKWIPVSEKYPEDGQRVLVDYCDEDMGIILLRFNVNGYRGFKAWMPLPEPYKESEVQDADSD